MGTYQLFQTKQHIFIQTNKMRSIHYNTNRNITHIGIENIFTMVFVAIHNVLLQSNINKRSESLDKPL